jgi:Putative transposase
MTEQVISPLRRRMIEDMTIRKFGQKTQHDYVRRVKEFAKPPESIPRYTRTGRCTRFSVASEVERRRHAEDQRHRRRTVVSAGSLAGPASSSPCACSRAFRLVLEKLAAAHRAGQLQSFGKHAELTRAQAFAAYLAPLRNRKWVVYSKRPFGGPAEALRYLARYTPLHPSRRYLEPPPGRAQRQRRHLQMEGLPPRRSGAIRRDDARYARVHPPLPDASVATGLPPHSLLRPAHQPDTRQQHHAYRRIAHGPAHPDRRHQAATTKPEEPQPPERRMRIIETFLPGQQPRWLPDPPPAKIRIDTS